MHRTSIRIAAMATALVLGTTGCQARDRAGGTAGQRVTTLTFANGNDATPDQLIGFAQDVERRSQGALKIEFKSAWRKGEVDSEQGIVEDVRAGKVDMAWVGPRVFDQLGVTDFQPLLAPLLVDSQSVQEAVFDAGIPTAMLSGVERLGVVGVGVLAGPLRRLLSKGAPFVSAAAMTGKRIGIQDSAVAEETFQALGATAVHLPAGAKIADVDGYEQQIDSIWGNHYEEQGGKNIVGNLNLWPRPLAIIMNKAASQRLTDMQRAILRDAAASQLKHSMLVSRSEDTQSVDSLCRSGIALPAATTAQLAKIKKLLQPVYNKIAGADPKNKAWLDQIREIKAQRSLEPDSVSCAGVPEVTPAPDGLLPDGIYRSLRTAADWTGCPLFTPPNNWRSMHEFVVEGNQVRQYSYPGATPTGVRELGFVATYQVYRDKFELLEDGTTMPLIFDYTFDGNSLTLSHLLHQPNIGSEYCAHTTVWTTHPWVRVEGATEASTAPQR